MTESRAAGVFAGSAAPGAIAGCAVAVCAGALAAASFGAGWPFPAFLAVGVSGLALGAAATLVLRPRRVLSAPAVADPSAAANAAFGELAPLLEALPDPALLVDGDGRVAGSNAAARRQLQFEASGLRLSAILRHPELLDAVQAAVHDGGSRTVEYETTAHVEEHMRAYVAPVAWRARAAALIVFHDQTAAIATERMRADFLANASHELRTPLAALSLLIETLSGPARGDTAAEEKFYAMMQAQAARMSRLIDDLLSLSRIELDEHVPPTDRADLAAVAQEAADSLSPLCAEFGVRIVVAAPARPALVIGDRFQLAQVAHNLIGNAIKYSPRGGVVEVEVDLAETRDLAVERAGRRWADAARVALLTAPPLPGLRYVYLRVADRGPGIARRHLPRLGERFFRPERDQSAERTGTGLGLAIVKHVVNRHRGGLLVESVSGVGSAFAIYVQRAGD